MSRPLTLSVFLISCLFLLLGYLHVSTAFDQDLGRHLLTSKIITQTHVIPGVNLFSYTYPTFTFINHHWLSEVIFYNLARATGTTGLFLLSLLLIVTTWGLVAQTALRKTHPLIFLVLSVIYLRILFERTDIRPELFSFLFLATVVTILYRYKEKFTKLIFLLIPLELLWVNMHIYFPIGVLVTLLFVIDNLVSSRKNLFNRQTKVLVAVFLLMGLITLFNPHGLSGATYPLRIFQNYGYTIEENQSPFFLLSLGFAKPSLPYLELAVGIVAIAFLIRFKKTRLIDWLLFVTFTAIAFNAVRNFPLFVFATFIPAVRSLSALLLASLKHLTPQKRLVIIRLAYFLVLIFILWQGKAVLALHKLGFGFEENAKAALTFFEKERLHGPIFNNFDIGSYIEYRLYPDEKVFIDGRPEAYPASFIQDTYIKMQADPSLFAKLSKKYNFNTIVFAHTDQTPWAEVFLRSIVHNPEWITVYLDPMMIILVRDVPSNQTVIKNFGKQLQNYSFPLPGDEKSLRTLGHFYGEIGLTKQLEEVLLRLLSSDPTDCNTLRILAQLYIQENHPAATLYTQRAQSCY